MLRSLAPILAAVVGGCSLVTNVDELTFDAGGGGAVLDAGPNAEGGPREEDAGSTDASRLPLDASVDAGCATRGTDVDLLIVVDESNSLAVAQQRLGDVFPELVDALLTGDVDNDLVADFPPLASLHVGAVSADMGTGGNSFPTCRNAMFGDDGVLLTTPGPDPMCSATLPLFLNYVPPGGLSELQRDIACLSQRTLDGCGFEQHLEALLKAMTPSTSPIRFFDNTLGHADGANAGFLRPDSVVMVLLLTDEDDCSAANPDLFSTSVEPYASADFNTRCVEFPSELFPISRYVSGLGALRAAGNSVVLVSIVGVPTDLIGRPYADILADPRMSVRRNKGLVEPACTDGTLRGDPGRRFVELSGALQPSGIPAVIGSICEASYQPTIVRALEALESVAPPVCGR